MYALIWQHFPKMEAHDSCGKSQYVLDLIWLLGFSPFVLDGRRLLHKPRNLPDQGYHTSSNRL